MQLASQYSERWLVQIPITADIVIWAGRDDNLKRVLPAFLNLEDTGLTHLEPEIRVSRKSNFSLELKLPAKVYVLLETLNYTFTAGNIFKHRALTANDTFED